MGKDPRREHAAIAPRFLGLFCVIAKSYARIHRKNLINFGILPLTFVEKEDYARIDQGDVLEIKNTLDQLKNNVEISVKNRTKNSSFSTKLTLTDQEILALKEGSLLNLALKKNNSA